MDHAASTSNEPPSKLQKRPKSLSVNEISAFLDDYPSGSEDEALADDSDEEFTPDNIQDLMHQVSESSDEESEELDEVVEITSDRRQRMSHLVKRDRRFAECNPSSLVPKLENENPSPLFLFDLLFDVNLIDLFVLESNKYIHLKSLTNVKTITHKNIRQFFGMLMQMSIMKLPQRHNSLEVKRGQLGYDPFFKIRPLITILNDNFKKYVEVESHQCVDEQIVPFKGHHHQTVYMNKNPIKWGYKLWARAGTSGYIYQFEMTGDLKENVTQINSSLGESGKVNRSGKCPLLTDKEMKTKGRGSVDYRLDKNSELIVCKWFDNKSVLLASNIHSIEPITQVKRYNKSKKEHVFVSCPTIVKNYNQCMGGLDKADMLLSLYRIFHKSRKWYKRLIFHFIDMAVINSWQLYKAKYGNRASENDRSLVKYKLELAQALMHSDSPQLIGRAITSAVVQDIRYDRIDHLPMRNRENFSMQRCKLSGCKSKTIFICKKCKVSLCIKNDPECFIAYHSK
ncbi:piggyBac transposable element-derived protein 1-like [Hydra vulgaris]|uniref:PiggyBac transposable element-derived protein 1-like n=1 Tax=Hydra vulgaris TaxID=6087 RepID=A0ABM4DCR1_HYDVU